MPCSVGEAIHVSILVVVVTMVAIHKRALGWLEPGTCFTQHEFQNNKLLLHSNMEYIS
jgi:hypothetical protein